MLKDTLERWREVLESNGLKMSKEKLNFLEFGFGNEAEIDGSENGLKLGGRVLNRVEKFKYLITVVQKLRE